MLTGQPTARWPPDGGVPPLCAAVPHEDDSGLFLPSHDFDRDVFGQGGQGIEDRAEGPGA